MRQDFAGAIRELRRTFADALDPYHPELHYMRGPGPKYRAKRAGMVTASIPTTADAAPPAELREFAQVRAAP